MDLTLPAQTNQRAVHGEAFEDSFWNKKATFSDNAVSLSDVT